ncbi:MAG: hypothetical protein QOJ25_2579 [Solirubrobacteraceae bacterium]|nr:hypothetical protein [Solirubrobacteraceae bacterium]
MRVRRVPILCSSLVIIALGLSGCGNRPAQRHSGDPENFGVYLDAGGISYQMQISRELNAYSTEDSQYLEGLPSGTAAPTPTQEWYAVFMWAWNQNKQPLRTAPPGSFDIVDTQGNTYYPQPIDPHQNPYQWTSQLLQPEATQPGPDTTAFFGPTQGQLLLFKISTTAYANRPLTLQIRGPQNQVEAVDPLDQ